MDLAWVWEGWDAEEEARETSATTVYRIPRTTPASHSLLILYLKKIRDSTHSNSYCIVHSSPSAFSTTTVHWRKISLVGSCPVRHRCGWCRELHTQQIFIHVTLGLDLYGITQMQTKLIMHNYAKLGLHKCGSTGWDLSIVDMQAINHTILPIWTI